MNETDNEQLLKELIEKIELKDQRFRLAQGTFIVLLILALLGLIFVQERTLTTSQHTLLAVQQSVNDVKTNNDAQLSTINRHIDCIVAYFGQPNRAQLTITDINRCTLANQTGVQQFYGQH